MIAIAMSAKFFAGMTQVNQDQLANDLRRFAMRRSVLVLNDLSSAPVEQWGLPVATHLPPAIPQQTWIVVGGGVHERADVISMTVGSETRAPGAAWVRDASQLSHLAAVAPESGIDMAMTRGDAAERRRRIMGRYAAELAQLDNRKTAYVFGAKRLGTVVAAGLRTRGDAVAAYLDNDPAVQCKHLDGTSILGVDESLDRSVPVIIGTTRFPFTLTKQLKTAGFEHVIPYPVMTLLDTDSFPTEIPYIDTYQDIAARPEKYLSEYLNYTDDRSRTVLNALLRYRLTLDSTVIQGHFEPESEQYFDRDLAKLRPGEVFVDAGGFDGQTTINFINRVNGDYGHIFYFEPDAKLMQLSHEALKRQPNLTYCRAGAFSRDGKATFCTTGTTNGSISDGAGGVGDVTIDVRKIDSVLTMPATFIKMDIEGAEPEALKGSRNQIQRHAPRLAVAAYHKGGDIWQLGELMRDLNPTYDLGLRHYTEGGLETIVYANKSART